MLKLNRGCWAPAVPRPQVTAEGDVDPWKAKQTILNVARAHGATMKKLRIVISGFGTARQEMVLE
jgi:hypothetical protein